MPKLSQIKRWKWQKDKQPAAKKYLLGIFRTS